MENVWLLLREPYTAFLAQLQDALASEGFPDLRPSHTGCIFAHLPAGGARLSELAARAGLRKQTISYYVDYLEERGYLERVADPADRRAKLVRPTIKGERAARAAELAIARIDGEWTRLLGQEPAAQLRDLLRRLSTALTETPDTHTGTDARPRA